MKKVIIWIFPSLDFFNIRIYFYESVEINKSYFFRNFLVNN